MGFRIEREIKPFDPTYPRSISLLNSSRDSTMFKIGDFSKLGQVSTRMLRHYDKLGLLVPSQTDHWTGYRYYTIEQLPRLHRVIALKELGLSLEQIGALLEKGDDLPVDQLRGMLLLRQSELQRELQEQQMRLVEVEARLRQIEQQGQPSPYEIVVKAVEALPVASVREIVPHVAEMGFYCKNLYHHLYKELGRLGVEPLTPEITLYHEEEYKETDLDVEIGVAVNEAFLNRPPATEDLLFRALPAAPLTAAMIYEGPFDAITEAILELLRWVGMHGHVPAGPLRELHLSGPAHPTSGDVVDSAIIELQIPIVKA
jgi:DNA-binding transcriptional MerR regulator